MLPTDSFMIISLKMSLENFLSQLWCHISFILAISGNSYVLYATVMRRAIRLDKLSIWIIQNLAVFDLINTILILTPVMISLYADSQWVLGATLCKISYTYKYFGFTANVVLINALSVNKAVCCVAPLRSLGSSKVQKSFVTVMTAVLAAIIPAYASLKSFALDEFVVLFSRSQCMCSSVQIMETGNFHKIVYYVLAATLNGLPCLTLLGINTFLVTYAAKKTRRAVKKTNIVIVVLITLSFLLSILPYFFYSMKYGNTHNDNDKLLRFVTFVTFTSLWSNPVIYLVTNESFRTFTAESARKISRTQDTTVQHVAI